MSSLALSRRSLLAAAAVAAGRLALPSSLLAQPATNASGRFPICTFVKYLQSLSFDELGQTIAGLGLKGIEATVRNKGQILPEHAEEQLPKLVEALQRHGVEIMIMASSINRVDQPWTEKVLRTAAGLGIKRYRMDYYLYDLNKPVADQLRELKPVVKDLAALNRQLGIQAVYQNHAGTKYVGAGLWDLHELLEGIPKEEIGVAYDIRHASIEGGQTWPVTWNLMQPHLAAVYVKDARWEGRKVQDGPLGWENGVVDPAFFKLLLKSDFNGPISLHVEYLEKGTIEENVTAIRENLVTLRKLLNQTA
ncbi:sugar phosphate isomerase/epimerase family protein [Planctomicrobium piriforme]|uniref:Sugar phosphate isomerase/epimerase n=1 Tax=Planctomicrobium piriforme TaxID=1576369 RepID=A0A1I3D7F4_9PLAN|nr:sugar phosphate isomerase/epimerase family protein [Planctomicrobium piriforme]SFH82664.1 Sugar phosphate isomerase/epimerase [Planctomicrobium piriforme]